MRFERVLGFLIKKSKVAETRHGTVIAEAAAPAFEKKKTYNKWVCEGCVHAYFYRVLRCPLCNGGSIRKQSYQTQKAVMIVK